MSTPSYRSKRRAASSSTPLDAASINALFDARANCKRRRLAWFNTKPGRDLRLRVPTHLKFDGPRGRCAICNVNNSCNTGGKKPRNRCNTCKVNLCLKSASPAFGLPNCWDDWHSSRMMNSANKWHRQIHLRLHLDNNSVDRIIIAVAREQDG